jgi:hypothetical protein
VKEVYVSKERKDFRVMSALMAAFFDTPGNFSVVPKRTAIFSARTYYLARKHRRAGVKFVR